MGLLVVLPFVTPTFAQNKLPQIIAIVEASEKLSSTNSYGQDRTDKPKLMMEIEPVQDGELRQMEVMWSEAQPDKCFQVTPEGREEIDPAICDRIRVAQGSLALGEQAVDWKFFHPEFPRGTRLVFDVGEDRQLERCWLERNDRPGWEACGKFQSLARTMIDHLGDDTDLADGLIVMERGAGDLGTGIPGSPEGELLELLATNVERSDNAATCEPVVSPHQVDPHDTVLCAAATFYDDWPGDHLRWELSYRRNPRDDDPTVEQIALAAESMSDVDRGGVETIPLRIDETRQLAVPVGDIRGVFTSNDYPALARRMGNEGTVRARLSVGPDGSVTGCDIVQSSGHAILDDNTCSILVARARFEPSLEEQAASVDRQYFTPPIRWEIPDRLADIDYLSFLLDEGEGFRLWLDYSPSGRIDVCRAEPMFDELRAAPCNPKQYQLAHLIRMRLPDKDLAEGLILYETGVGDFRMTDDARVRHHAYPGERLMFETAGEGMFGGCFEERDGALEWIRCSDATLAEAKEGFGEEGRPSSFHSVKRVDPADAPTFAPSMRR